MRWATMLRGINVSGHRKVSMKELVAVCEDLGYQDVESYVQSGNLVFDPGKASAKTVAGELEKAIESAFGYPDVDVLLRTDKELSALVKGNPYLTDGADPKTLHVTVLKTKPTKSLSDDGTWSPDGFTVTGRDVYVVCPNGYGRTKLNNSFFESKLGVRATTRNWRTISTLAELTAG
jgi:uncharacterized protein (DUF1697 family)